MGLRAAIKKIGSIKLPRDGKSGLAEWSVAGKRGKWSVEMGK